ncbi:C-3 sterol dehydrogenase/C-4 decarboxylase family protein [Drechmeria coniospora]|uniref:Sterol-4-alpha-carboxylate 3-dehydrogenase ERG26, decarboxylating n=1 Tax=Drechmeria coniospora TaxID=98403 RepID=A0A151GEB1_DRECN|nr:C-3 sterol dehydrogenase/C-4 decarboxylase family protein [Drechmeria coniospora]KYK55429.1 C-3 sterol dehydrogenase/C-4 decarboxylase family protein [Drechmeria coniospora]
MAPEAKAEAGKPRGDLGHVLIIGGNGFLGHHIVNQALASSAWAASAVTSIDLRCDKNRNAKATYRECDITDAPRLLALFEELKPDVVIHTASPVASGQTAVAHDLFRKVNVDGTRAVVEACQRSDVKALVYTSSASVISDNQTDLLNADERWPVIRGAQQHEYYSETKAAAEELVLDANRQSPSNLLTASIRPAGIFGEGDVQTLAGFLRAYHARRTGTQLGDNANIFDFTYVGNVAHAHLLAAHALLVTAAASIPPLDHEKVDGEVFFITNDAPCYFWDFARAVWRAAGHDEGTERVWALPRSVGIAMGLASEVFCRIVGIPPTFTRQRAVISTMTRYYNISKAKMVLRYQPLWTLQEGVSRGVAWFLEQEKKAAVKAQ